MIRYHDMRIPYNDMVSYHDILLWYHDMIPYHDITSCGRGKAAATTHDLCIGIYDFQRFLVLKIISKKHNQKTSKRHTTRAALKLCVKPLFEGLDLI